jgi:hypothetical protein
MDIIVCSFGYKQTQIVSMAVTLLTWAYWRYI